MVDIGRNEDCPCGSGVKYKLCCGKPEGHLEKRMTKQGLMKALCILLKDRPLKVKVDDLEVESGFIKVHYDWTNDTFELSYVAMTAEIKAKMNTPKIIIPGIFNGRLN